MTTKELNKQLLLTQQKKARSWGKILFQLKRQFDVWAMAELAKAGYPHFKMAHVPFIMNIDADGITNNDLAKTIGITKQGMSKVIRELEQLKYITTKIDKKDKRSAHIFLTASGKKFVLNARLRVFKLEADYEKLLGKKNYNLLKDLLLSILAQPGGFRLDNCR